MSETRDRPAPPAPPPPGPLFWVKRVLLAALTALLAVNLYTGAPLLAVWVGSRVQGGPGLTMSTVGAVIGVLVVTVAVLVVALQHTEAAYKRLTGVPVARRTAPWMRSMRGESDAHVRERQPLGGFEKILVACVVLAIAAFEAWFFVLSGSPIGKN